MKLLNDGDSFSATRNITSGREGGKICTSYCEFFDFDVVNLAGKGACIYSKNVKNFVYAYTLDKDATEKITHFVYQVPTPARQVVHKPLIKTDAYLDICMDSRPLSRAVDEYLKKYKYGVNRMSEEMEIERDDMLSGMSLQAHLSKESFDVDKYYEKAICEVDKIVFLLKSIWPHTKIILLRYEMSGNRFKAIETFSHLFFKKTLSDYAKSNKVIYIYEDNFCTDWFDKNGLTVDGSHTNKKGGRLIFDKLMEYI